MKRVLKTILGATLMTGVFWGALAFVGFGAGCGWFFLRAGFRLGVGLFA